MPTSYEDKIKEQAQPYLDAGEHVLAAFVAQARGATTAKMAGLGPSAIGGMKTGKQRRAAEEAGLQLANPMALALTESRLLVLGISQPIALGKGGDVKDLVSAALPYGGRLDRGQTAPGRQDRDRHRPRCADQTGGRRRRECQGLGGGVRAHEGDRLIRGRQPQDANPPTASTTTYSA